MLFFEALFVSFFVSQTNFRKKETFALRLIANAAFSNNILFYFY